MNIKTLKDINTSIVADCFNQAFEGYFVPIKLSEQDLKNKIKSENIDLSISVGAFKNDRLVAFILFAKSYVENKKTFYNAGTGVIPSARKKRLTEKLYHYILPKLYDLNFEQGTLEVVNENLSAIKIYEHLGYKMLRKLICYNANSSKSNRSNFDSKISLSIHPYSLDQHTHFENFWNWRPSWQNQTSSLINNSTSLKNILAKNEQGQIIAYLCFDNNTGRIKQIAVIDKERRKGIATAMLSYLSTFHQKKSMINVDANDIATNSFLKKEGFKESLVQYEMVLKLHINTLSRS